MESRDARIVAANESKHGKEGWSGGKLPQHSPDPSRSANVDVLCRRDVEAT